MSHGYIEIAGVQRRLQARGRVSVTSAGQFAAERSTSSADADHWFTVVAASSAVWLLGATNAPGAWLLADQGAASARLGAGQRLPIVFSRTAVRFPSRMTQHQFDIVLDRPMYAARTAPLPPAAPRQVPIRLNAEQRLMLLVLGERTLRRGTVVATGIPTTADAARRLGWSTTKLSRKLDNLCARLESLGVGGMHGDRYQLALHRRSALIEFAIANGLITPEDLESLHDFPTSDG